MASNEPIYRHWSAQYLIDLLRKAYKKKEGRGRRRRQKREGIMEKMRVEDEREDRCTKKRGGQGWGEKHERMIRREYREKGKENRRNKTREDIFLFSHLAKRYKPETMTFFPLLNTILSLFTILYVTLTTTFHRTYKHLVSTKWAKCNTMNFLKQSLYKSGCVNDCCELILSVTVVFSPCFWVWQFITGKKNLPSDMVGHVLSKSYELYPSFIYWLYSAPLILAMTTY